MLIDGINLEEKLTIPEFLEQLFSNSTILHSSCPGQTCGLDMHRAEHILRLECVNLLRPSY